LKIAVASPRMDWAGAHSPLPAQASVSLPVLAPLDITAPLPDTLSVGCSGGPDVGPQVEPRLPQKVFHGRRRLGFQAHAMFPSVGEVEGPLDAGLLSFTEIGFGSPGHGSFRPMPASVPRSSAVGGCEGRIPFVRAF